MLNHLSIQESRAKYILPVCLGRVLTILWVGFHLALEKLKVILQNNEYPPTYFK